MMEPLPESSGIMRKIGNVFSSLINTSSSDSCPLTENIAQRALACLTLGAVGDTLGFGSGHTDEEDEIIYWELSHDTRYIFYHLNKKYQGDWRKIRFRNGKKQTWVISDDTLLHFSQAKILADLVRKKSKSSTDEIIQTIAKEHVKIVSYQAETRRNERCFGQSTRTVCKQIQHDPEHWKNHVLYNPEAIGCGGAMRGMVFGLTYPGNQNRTKLIEASLKAGFLSNPSVTGAYGTLATAALTAFALEDIPVARWIPELLTIFQQGQQFLIAEKSGSAIPPHYVQLITECSREDNLAPFINGWKSYQSLVAKGEAVIPGADQFPLDPDARDGFYLNLQEVLSGKPNHPKWMSIGDQGHTSVMLALHGLMLGVRRILDAAGHSGDNGTAVTPSQLRRMVSQLSEDQKKAIVDDLVKFTILHGGDCDSTGGIALSLYGTMFGFAGMEPAHIAEVEIAPEVEKVASSLSKIAKNAIMKHQNS